MVRPPIYCLAITTWPFCHLSLTRTAVLWYRGEGERKYRANVDQISIRVSHFTHTPSNVCGSDICHYISYKKENFADAFQLFNFKTIFCPNSISRFDNTEVQSDVICVIWHQLTLNVKWRISHQNDDFSQLGWSWCLKKWSHPLTQFWLKTRFKMK